MSAIGRAAASLAALGLALLLLGCAADSGTSGDGRHHGFYGGVEAGGSRLW